MTAYIIRRLLLIIPTLFGIMLINFAIIQAAPGGPVEQMLAQLQGLDSGAKNQISGSGNDIQSASNNSNHSTSNTSTYQGARGLPPELIQRIEKMYGFDKPAHERFFMLLKNYLSFNFGDSYSGIISIFGLHTSIYGLRDTVVRHDTNILASVSCGWNCAFELDIALFEEVN